MGFAQGAGEAGMRQEVTVSISLWAAGDGRTTNGSRIRENPRKNGWFDERILKGVINGRRIGLTR